MGEINDAIGNAVGAAADPVLEYIDLTRDKKRLQDALKKVNEQLRERERIITTAWRADGTQHVKRDGATVYLSRDLSVRVEDRARVREALEALGLRDLLAPNAAQLKAWIKEQLHREDTGEWFVDPERLPEDIREAIALEEYVKRGCRGA